MVICKPNKNRTSLFETALNYGNYSCFHLSSIIDFRIKTNNSIHEFIDKHTNTEFMGFYQTKIN